MLMQGTTNLCGLVSRAEAPPDEDHPLALSDRTRTIIRPAREGVTPIVEVRPGGLRSGRRPPIVAAELDLDSERPRGVRSVVAVHAGSPTRPTVLVDAL